MNVHYEDPFATPAELREPARRLRGRLPLPVTIWTAGPPDARAGLTVSSVVVAEGEPSKVLGLVGPLTVLWDAIEDTGKFVVHLLGPSDKVLADRFAGLRPSPGGLFVDLGVEDTAWGPEIVELKSRAYCRLEQTSEPGFQKLVVGVIERIFLDETTDPLVFYRGRYRTLREAP
jgi:3-hydroxy-9,10-secoandrosta-1,3,5(10)-triene-9,17-dione monooxygenase reductase component